MTLLTVLNLEIGTTLILKEYSNNLKQRNITRERENKKRNLQNVDNEMIHLDIYIYMCVSVCVCISMNDYYD